MPIDDELSGYEGEVRHLLQAIVDGRAPLAATLTESEEVARILEAERQSLEEDRSIEIG